MSVSVLEALERAETVAPEEAPAVTLPKPGERPCWRVFDDWLSLDSGKRKLRPGVYWCSMTDGKKDEPPAPVETWVSGPLHLKAQTFDEHKGNFGRLLRFKNTAGDWREWAMPQELLAGSGEELRRELLAMGLEISPRQRLMFGDYLQSRVPKSRVRCATSVGWCGRHAFVLPDEVVGPGRATVIFQSGERTHEEHGQAGTLDAWRELVAARAIGNPLLMLGISAAFVGPLLWPAKQEPGGLHLVGDSSTGKSTILEAARSVWGGASFKRSWRATANGLEGVSVLHNDGLLPLDELSECDPREVGAIAYLLGNGQGKSRASRTGAARAIKRWLAFVLSTGERTLAATMAEGGHRAKAGQGVRLLDVPANRRHGCFDELHGHNGGRALADAVKQAAAEHYGQAGRLFLEKLTEDCRDFGAMLERLKGLELFKASDGGGQASRAGGRFALVAMAGELATEYGVTGWPQGAATTAAAEAFRLWCAWRGEGQDEPRKILEAVRDFIDRHGSSRFAVLKPTPGIEHDDPLVRDRAGWWDGTEDLSGRVYYLTAEAMREAAKGFDLKRALDALGEVGALPPPNAKGERAKSINCPDGNKRRLYAVTYSKLEGAVDAGS